MPACCIKQCGARKNKNLPDLTIHRFPVNKILKEKWLSVIGITNINPRHKLWYVCSKHFEESCFNRTLGVTRLRENAVPSACLTQIPKQIIVLQPSSSGMIQECSTTSIQVPELSPKEEIITEYLEELPMDADDITENALPPPKPTNGQTKSPDQRQKISLLQRKVRILTQKLRRNNMKQSNLKTLIKAVRVYTKSSEIENILRGNFRKLCAAFNNNGVSVNYSDEVIKFAITVHYYSPKAYEFIRKFMSLPTERMLRKYASSGAYILNIDE